MALTPNLNTRRPFMDSTLALSAEALNGEVPTRPGTRNVSTSGAVESSTARGLSPPASITAAPAPSPKSTQVARSVQSSARVICSAATTSTRLGRDRGRYSPRRHRAQIRSRHKPPRHRRQGTSRLVAQQRHTPQREQGGHPSSSSRRSDPAGLASIPDTWSARSLAATARSSSDSVVQTWRLLIPVRVKIHSSEVSRNSDSSSLETLRSEVPNLFQES